MGQKHAVLSDKHQAFIRQQKLFFVGTAPIDGQVNISPKGMDSLRVLNNKRVIWLNVTGSGNETSAHVQENSRMTLMFAAFEGKPMILRLYGEASVIHPGESGWHEWLPLFGDMPGARQLFDLSVELVQTSCGMAVPLFDYVADREHLKDWARKKGDAGINDYWLAKNQFTIDGKPTHILEKNAAGKADES